MPTITDLSVLSLIIMLAAIAIAVVALGGCSSSQELIAVNTDLEQPLLDINPPAEYETATFSMG